MPGAFYLTKNILRKVTVSTSSPAPSPHQMSSLLRWAGSKRALLPRLAELVGDEVDEYIEPFCGSAALFFSLKPNSAFLYDLNPNLIQTLKAIKCHHVDVFEAFGMLEGTKDAYYILRDRYNSEQMDEIAAAATFLYLGNYPFDTTNHIG